MTDARGSWIHLDSAQVLRFFRCPRKGDWPSRPVADLAKQVEGCDGSSRNQVRTDLKRPFAQTCFDLPVSGTTEQLVGVGLEWSPSAMIMKVRAELLRPTERRIQGDERFIVAAEPIGCDLDG